MAVKPRYAYHAPTPEQLEAMNRLREAFSQLDDLITDLCGSNRAASSALTRLEEAATWANKAVVLGAGSNK